MNLDDIIGILIVPAIFIWLGSKIYNHEKEHIDPIIRKIKGWFPDNKMEETFDSTIDYNITYKGAEY